MRDCAVSGTSSWDCFTSSHNFMCAHRSSCYCQVRIFFHFSHNFMCAHCSLYYQVGNRLFLFFSWSHFVSPFTDPRCFVSLWDFPRLRLRVVMKKVCSQGEGKWQGGPHGSVHSACFGGTQPQQILWVQRFFLVFSSSSPLPTPPLFSILYFFYT